jgi:hypothetical protein
VSWKPSPPPPTRRERLRRWFQALWYRVTPEPRAWVYSGSDCHCWGSFYALWLAKFWCWRNGYTYDVIGEHTLVVHDWEEDV